MCRLVDLTFFVASWLYFANSLESSNLPGLEKNVETDSEEYLQAAANAYANAAAQSKKSEPLTNQVECYACIDCPNLLPTTVTKRCAYTSNYTKQNKCVVYAEKYKHMKKPWYIRGCASERGSCAEIREAHSYHTDIVTLASCYECEGDNCNINGVSRSHPDLMTALILVMVTPLLAKYVVS